MKRIQWAAAAAILGWAISGGDAIAKKADKPAAAAVTPSMPSVADASGVYLRNSFEADPSRFLGAFLMDDVTVPDETNAAKLACSNYVIHDPAQDVIDAGGTTVDGLFSTSASAAMRLGVPQILGLKGSYDRGTTLLVHYSELQKHVSRVEDPAGFAECCASTPGQCRKLYVGEFITGTGKVYAEVEAEKGAKITPLGGPVTGGVSVYGGKHWALAREFTSPVAFAFRFYRTPDGSAGEELMCASDWLTAVPTDLRGHWEVAESDWMADVAGPRLNAYDHAAVQVARWCGIGVQVDSVGGRVGGNDSGSAPKVVITDETKWKLVAQAIVRRLELRCSKPEQRVMGDYTTQYRMAGLYLLPRASVEATCAEAVSLAGGTP